MILHRLRQNRLVLQLLFTFIAAVSFATVGAIIIADAIKSAESAVLGEAKRSLAVALNELKQQHRYRARSDPQWVGLPIEAKNASQRGITDTVLRSYPGVEGGFYSTTGKFLGYGYPTHDTGATKTDVPAAESGLIAEAARRSLTDDKRVEEVIRGKIDLLVLAAVRSDNPNTAIWCMKRLAGRARANHQPRLILLVILIIAALASISGALVTGIELARGVAEIKSGLAVLEKNFDYQLPERRDELGTISQAVNRMASVRRRLEAHLRREDRLRALGRLAAGLAHEIRNPLNSIRLTVQLLDSRLRTGRVRHADLEAIQTEVDRLNVLLNELLDLQGTRQPVLNDQPVLPVIEHCAEVLGRQADLRGVRLELDGVNPRVCASFDSQQLTQTVMNLILNALEASKAGDRINVRLQHDSGNVTVEVHDTGPGLDAEQQDHLFEPFYTTKPSGTGLGLAVSRELMRSQGGDLSYRSSAQGACFIVHLPRKYLCPQRS